jgi:hypothetical protein
MRKMKASVHADKITRVESVDERVDTRKDLQYHRRGTRYLPKAGISSVFFRSWYVVCITHTHPDAMSNESAQAYWRNVMSLTDTIKGIVGTDPTAHANADADAAWRWLLTNAASLGEDRLALGRWARAQAQI